MPGMTGLDLLDQLPYLPLVIFTTSNTEYAFDAYEYDVTDFLKKPIAMPRLLKAMEKVNQRLDGLNDVAASSAHTEIYIKTDGRFIRIPFSEIFFFENVGDYIKAVTTMGNFIFYSTIKALDQKISNPRFLKVHRSFIVNLDKIKDIEDNTLVIEKSVIPISRAHKIFFCKASIFFSRARKGHDYCFKLPWAYILTSAMPPSSLYVMCWPFFCPSR